MKNTELGKKPEELLNLQGKELTSIVRKPSALTEKETRKTSTGEESVKLMGEVNLEGHMVVNMLTKT